MATLAEDGAHPTVLKVCVDCGSPNRHMGRCARCGGSESVDMPYRPVEDFDPMLNLLRYISEQPCLARVNQPSNCSELPGYEKRLWCITCTVRDQLPDLAGSVDTE